MKADPHIQIQGSSGRIFTISSAIDDMEAYTKLTGASPVLHESHILLLFFKKSPFKTIIPYSIFLYLLNLFLFIIEKPCYTVLG